MATTTPQKAKKGKKHRKIGRNALYCLRYAAAHRREHNKVRRLKRHLKRFPADKIAEAAAQACMVAIRGY